MIRYYIHSLGSLTEGCVGLLFIYLFSMAAVAAPEQGHGKNSVLELDLYIRDGLFTLETEAASLQQVLYAIGEQTGIRISIDGDLHGVTRSFSYQEKEPTKVVADILNDYSTVMLYQSTKDNKNTEQLTEQLVEVWVYVNNSAEAQIQIHQNLVASTSTANQIKQIDRLEGIKQQEVIDALANHMRHSSDSLVRLRAVVALIEIGGVSVLPALKTGMSDSSSLIRNEMAEAFGEIRDQSTLLSLGQLVMGDVDSSVRETAVRSLAKYKSTAARSFIKAALKDKAENVRNAANEMLSR
ncbi:MAG: HEAT repeat domain-containing protein [Pseudomonadales bacterium]|nr:HEAT repeat domain-containing protein [Pseudomonadales bacterium]